jgi:hypothetical protein
MKPDEIQLPDVVLTDDEHQECQEFVRSIVKSDDGEWVVKEEFADALLRSMIGACLMGRAERLLAEAGGDQISSTFHIPHFGDGSLDSDKAERACITAAKACAIFPLSINFYDFGCVLLQVGKINEAKAAFSQFLSSAESDATDPVKQIWLKQRNTTVAVEYCQVILKATA